MPQIKGYESQIRAQGPVDTPKANVDTMGGQAGRGLEKFGDALMGAGEIVRKRQEQNEISDVSARLARAQAEYTTQWQEALKTADPGDTELAARFNKEMSDGLSAIRDSISTPAAQQHFDGTASKIQSHFFEATYAGQSQLAGIKAVEDYKTARNSRSAAIVSDPTQFQLAMELDQADLEARVKTGLPREAAMKLSAESRKEMAFSAVLGWKELNPTEAMRQLKGGDWDQYIDGTDKAKLIGHVDQELRAREVEAHRQRAESERIKKDKQEAFMTEAFNRIIDGSFSTKDITSSNLEFGQKKQLLNMLEEESKQKIRTDVGTMIKLFDDIHSGKLTDEADLNQYVIDRRLGFEDLNRLRAEFQGRKTTQGKMESEWKEDFFKGARRRLSKSNDLLGATDPEGDEQYLKFRIQSELEYQEGIKAGKKPKDLLSPESPDYIGKKLTSFEKSGRDIIREKAARMRNTPSVTPTPAPTPPPVSPRKDGESAADYLKRTKGG